MLALSLSEPLQSCNVDGGFRGGDEFFILVGEGFWLLEDFSFKKNI